MTDLLVLVASITFLLLATIPLGALIFMVLSTLLEAFLEESRCNSHAKKKIQIE